MKRILFSCVFIWFIVFNLKAQSFSQAFGIQLTALDFYGPQTGKYFIHEGWNYPKTKYRNHLYWNPALQINYWKSINTKFAFKSSFLLSSFLQPSSKKDSNYIKNIQSNNEIENFQLILETKINYNFLSLQKNKITCYATTGLAFMIGNPTFNMKMPIGFGANFKLSNLIFLNYESNYYNSISKNSGNYLNHSFGINIKLKSQKVEKKFLNQNEINPKKITELNIDSDNDGIVDSEDLCKNLAGKKENHGCPDSDHDGIYDHEDKCPEQSGSSFLLGCPDEDGDGIIDLEDKCPTEKGMIFNNGCPEQIVDYDKLINSAAKGISFESSKAILKKESFVELDKILIVLEKEIAYNIEIEGHSDSSGDENKNIELSQQRADVCKQYFVEKGISEDRISSVGFGSMKPLVDNLTPENRAKNRRIEFILIKQ